MMAWFFLNENLTNAFNISAYFSDPNGDNLTYYTNYTDPFNVTVSFNYSSGYVSFYPDTGFSGLLNLTFIASDGLVNASSNRVFLRVGLDNESPQWYNASKSISAIEQNDVVSFLGNVD